MRQRETPEVCAKTERIFSRNPLTQLAVIQVCKVATFIMSSEDLRSTGLNDRTVKQRTIKNICLEPEAPHSFYRKKPASFLDHFYSFTENLSSQGAKELFQQLITIHDTSYTEEFILVNRWNSSKKKCSCSVSPQECVQVSSALLRLIHF